MTLSKYFLVLLLAGCTGASTGVSMMPTQDVSQPTDSVGGGLPAAKCAQDTPGGPIMAEASPQPTCDPNQFPTFPWNIR